ncbi:type II toxin-antitoxin system RelE/ParE family toxin [Enterobacter sp. Bisph1]|uniref:type II toxin-antitoxin system RelE/ParE family toxin n=1 Tax=Enterobacter sp. Bisph1 TaxID=1274399 RepID=UPI0012E02EFE|nr:type II toxin-antitoxin system RelE/ParE family toxin [Enterobacter sp. Bisph1]
MTSPKAEEDPECIWNYSFRQFGMVKADEYIGRISAVFHVLGVHQIGTPRPEPGEKIFALPSEKHVIYFIPETTVVTISRILNPSQENLRHQPWRKTSPTFNALLDGYTAW